VKFLLDHDVPEDLSYLLEQLGHEVTLLREALPQDVSDETVLQSAHERGCVVLTCNRDDFLELATKLPHHGIVLVRLSRVNPDVLRDLLGMAHKFATRNATARSPARKRR
jgi:predicted nuclease of predicted toxin-antitoxin system